MLTFERNSELIEKKRKRDVVEEEEELKLWNEGEQILIMQSKAAPNQHKWARNESFPSSVDNLLLRFCTYLADMPTDFQEKPLSQPQTSQRKRGNPRG